MKAAARPALVPVVVLYAALAAAPEAAWAGEELRAPFPGAASEGGERTTEAAPRPSGATAASPVAPPDTPAAGDETANAADGTAGPEGAAANAAAGMPAGKGAPQNRVREMAAETPAGGSRLLRALAEIPRAPVAPDDDASGSSGAAPFSGASVSGTRVFAAEGCPRALLQRLLAGAAGETDALAALGIEREILALCRERQEILAGLFEAEAALRELRTPPDAPAAAVPPPAQTGAVSVVPAPTRQVAPAPAPSPLRAALAAAEDEATEAEPQAPARVSPARVSPARVSSARVSPAQVSPRYAWFSIVGAAGALRAGITDGADVWFVREGDPLPGGVTVGAIAARPPGVRVTDGDGNGGTALLPYEGTSFSRARVSSMSVAGTRVRALPGESP